MAAAEPGARKRRPKGHFAAAGRAKRPRGGGGRQLEAGMRGILITCNMNERKCVGEAYSLLGEYGDLLYGPEQFSDHEERLSGSDREEDEDDVEAALKKEVGQIRASTEQKLRRFQSVESGANNVVFIRTQGIEPENLVHHILKDMHTTKKKKTRVILRMLPISGTCKAFMEDMKKYTETFFEPWFKAPNKGTFQIVYKARNNSHMSREEVIKELAGIVGSLNPENKVDLNNPQYTVVVEIIKTVCCLSVVRDYVLFRKYNLQEVVKSNKEDTQQNPSSVTEEQNSKVVKPETEEEKSSKEVKQENKNQGEIEAEPKGNDALTV
ncbi:PREDICTED: THUMP domain-containing protein 1 [Lepidothrix coronata]|uniref:THUMP domain-containing protein 1 n=1 Tax=Lepidothrix coronata TaxID=321398 RepID=A0A6J0H2L8_9PASS|nr:PREDICTED: THUMP domain-containing protein 1 [Lepidothrix coronata]XP_051663954.1 THUMP domain-containing protein 1 [Manacus candei]